MVHSTICLNKKKLPRMLITVIVWSVHSVFAQWSNILFRFSHSLWKRSWPVEACTQCLLLMWTWNSVRKPHHFQMGIDFILLAGSLNVCIRSLVVGGEGLNLRGIHSIIWKGKSFQIQRQTSMLLHIDRSLQRQTIFFIMNNVQQWIMHNTTKNVH